MKYIITILYMILILQLNSQVVSFENDKKSILSAIEGALLDSIVSLNFEKNSFGGKKVLFVTGNQGSRIVEKDFFFNNLIYPWLEDGQLPSVKYVNFTSTEYYKSGGYSGVFLAWVKKFPKRRRNELINLLEIKE